MDWAALTVGIVIGLAFYALWVRVYWYGSGRWWL